MIWYSGPIDGFCLYSISPIALDKLRLPFTLPYETVPPAFVILFNYYLSSGLWSFDIYLQFPLIQATPRESPELAT